MGIRKRQWASGRTIQSFHLVQCVIVHDTSAMLHNVNTERLTLACLIFFPVVRDKFHHICKHWPIGAQKCLCTGFQTSRNEGETTVSVLLGVILGNVRGATATVLLHS